jgi:hypothetical protein
MRRACVYMCQQRAAASRASDGVEIVTKFELHRDELLKSLNTGAGSAMAAYDHELKTQVCERARARCV